MELSIELDLTNDGKTGEGNDLLLNKNWTNTNRKAYLFIFSDTVCNSVEFLCERTGVRWASLEKRYNILAFFLAHRHPHRQPELRAQQMICLIMRKDSMHWYILFRCLWQSHCLFILMRCCRYDYDNQATVRVPKVPWPPSSTALVTARCIYC